MLRRRKVLIAEDEPNIAAALEFLLGRHGYEVRVATDGDQALALVASYHPDVVLLDVMMPAKSGYEVCRRMRERAEWRDIRIVMLSAKGREADVSKGISSGADHFITKPFSTREVVETLDHFCGGAASGGE